MNRRCPNMSVLAAEEDEDTELETEVQDRDSGKKSGKKGTMEKKKKVQVEWRGSGEEQDSRTMYSSAMVDHCQVRGLVKYERDTVFINN